MDLPVRVRFRNQNRAVTSAIATTTVSNWEDFIARPSLNPVISLKARALMINRSPSKKFWSFGPMIKRTTPFITNITPTDAITMRIGGALVSR